jgi:hypothetical protein
MSLVAIRQGASTASALVETSAGSLFLSARLWIDMTGKAAN